MSVFALCSTGIHEAPLGFTRCSKWRSKHAGGRGARNKSAKKMSIVFREGKPMSDKMFESLSAAMDNEASTFELRRALDEAGRSPQLREAWMRYHAIGAVLREEWQAGGSEMRERIHHSSHAAPASVTRRRRLRDAWGSGRGRAVAAALAVVAAMAVVLSVSPAGVPVGEPGGQTSAGPLPGETGGQTLRGGTPLAEFDRLNAYMLHHVQHRAMHRPGVSSFTKVVTYAAADTP